MATAYPRGSFLPAIFSDSSPDTTKTNLDLHSGALNVYDFTSDAAGATTLFLTFVIFDYPNAANAAQPAPARPVVEMLMVAAASLPPNFDAPGVALADTTMTGTQAFAVPGGSINYTYISLGGGVFQINFTTDDVAFDALQWHIRFTVTDGATSATHQKGVTFVVDSAKTTQPWIAVPGQLNLTAAGPAPIDFAAALSGITLAGPAPSGAELVAGKTYTVLLPIGNYGTAPLTISSVSPTEAMNAVSIRLLTAPLTIAPGGVDATMLQATFQAPPGGQSGGPATATVFTLVSNDPLAAGSGAMSHFDVISLFAVAAKPPPTLKLTISPGAVAIGNNGVLPAVAGMVSINPLSASAEVFLSSNSLSACFPSSVTLTAVANQRTFPIWYTTPDLGHPNTVTFTASVSLPGIATITSSATLLVVNEAID